MKISFSICPISDPDYCYIDKTKAIEVLKECDLVFSVATARAAPRAEAKQLFGDKYVPLNKIRSSLRIVRYLRTKEISYPEESAELETIYQSLPKGVELTIYTVSYFENREGPTKITLPYD